MRLAPILVVAALAGVASADTVKLQFVGKGAGANVNITGPGYSGGVFAGQLNHAFTAGTGAATGWIGTKPTFCIELAEHVTNTALTYELKDLADVPGDPGPMTAARAGAVRELYDLAGGAQFQTGSSAANIAAAAFQIAVWELVFDFASGDSSSINLGAGSFKLNTTGDVKTKAMQWLGQILGDSSGSTQLVGLHNDGKQDQVVMVPLPAPVLMGLAGLVAVAGVRRLRK